MEDSKSLTPAQSESGTDNVHLEGGQDSNANPNQEASEASSGGEKRKNKRNRWNIAPEELPATSSSSSSSSPTTTTTTTTNEEGANGSGEKKKRSRWGVDAEGRPVAEPVKALVSSTPVDAAEALARAASNAAAITQQLTKSLGSALAPPPADATAIVPYGTEIAALLQLTMLANQGPVNLLPHNAADPKDQAEIIELQARIDKLNVYITNPKLLMQESGARSPSPEPIYDERGHRTNTREQRIREKLNKEKSELMERMAKINPAYRSAAMPKAARPFKKIYLPSDPATKNNYMGMIIGPRGMTQKRLQKETGCMIMVRGKGASKEGKYSYGYGVGGWKVV